MAPSAPKYTSGPFILFTVPSFSWAAPTTPVLWPQDVSSNVWGSFFCCVKLVLLQCILLEILVLFIRNTHYAWQQLLILKPNSRPASSPSCPALAETLCYSGPGMGSSHFVAYSSCYCSLSALWDSCLDPLRHVTLDMTLSSSLTAGSRATSCIPVSFPLPALSALCSSPSISICPCVYAACFQKLCPQKRL